MKKFYNKLKQNKGFSLAELLVALAVGSVVILIIGAFITQGTRFFNRQSNSINLQNELQELSNVISDTLQEASYLDLNKTGGAEKAFSILTGKKDVVDGVTQFVSVTGTERDIEWEEGKPLYIFDSVAGSEVDSEDMAGYEYSNHITKIRVSIDDKCKLSANQFSQPLILKLEITVGYGKEERSASKTITLRNYLDGFVYGGKEYVRGINNILALPTT